MANSAFVRLSLTALIAGGFALHGTGIQAQEQGGTVQTDKVQAINSGPNVYRVIRNWARIEGRPWGRSNGVAIDAKNDRRRDLSNFFMRQKRCDFHALSALDNLIMGCSSHD